LEAAVRFFCLRDGYHSAALQSGIEGRIDFIPWLRRNNMNTMTLVRAWAGGSGSPLGLAFGGLARRLVRDRALLKLHRLDDRLLLDIGLIRADLETMRHNR
jgi:uncharacterized protein YjiS (DUF1127 family)